MCVERFTKPGTVATMRAVRKVTEQSMKLVTIELQKALKSIYINHWKERKLEEAYCDDWVITMDLRIRPVSNLANNKN